MFGLGNFVLVDLGKGISILLTSPEEAPIDLLNFVSNTFGDPSKSHPIHRDRLQNRLDENKAPHPRDPFLLPNIDSSLHFCNEPFPIRDSIVIGLKLEPRYLRPSIFLC